MARLPSKPVRFLVWISASGEHRDDVLTAFDERFAEVYEKWGPLYAHGWSISQAMRSMPYWLWLALIKLVSVIWKNAD